MAYIPKEIKTQLTPKQYAMLCFVVKEYEKNGYINSYVRSEMLKDFELEIRTDNNSQNVEGNAVLERTINRPYMIICEDLWNKVDSEIYVDEQGVVFKIDSIITGSRVYMM